MQIYNPPLKDIKFVLEAFGYNEKVASLPAFADFDLSMVMEVMEIQ